MSQDAPALTLQALTRFLVSDSPVAETLQRITEIARDAIPAAEMAGISLLDPGTGPATPIYTDETSPAIDEGQYRDGRGPCLDAWRDCKVVRVDDVAAVVSSYPSFTRAALDHLNLDGAFRLLVEAARRQDVAVRESARQVVDQRELSVSHA